MKNVDIVWFIEHISRELDVACAVNVYLKRQFGITIKILPYNQSLPKDIFLKYNPKIVVIPYCYSVHDQGLRGLLSYWLKPIYVNLSWEQLFYKANLEYKAPRDKFSQKYVFHHVWSQNYSEHLKIHGVPKEHIFINGQPAYKLYEQPYRNCFATREELADRFNLSKDYRWIFFPENYSWAFYSPHQIEQIIKYGQDRKKAYLMRNYCRNAFQKVMQWLKDLRKDKVAIILRPRPATKLSDFFAAVYETMQTIPPNLHIIQDCSVREWILSSDIVISSFSTSLIEAAIANKPVYMVEPILIPKSLQANWYKYASRITSKDEFHYFCLNSVDRNSGAKLRNWAKTSLLGNSDPIFNIAKFLDSLIALRITRPSILTKSIIRDSSALLPKMSKISRFYSWVIDRLKSNNSTELFEKEVRERMEIFNKVLYEAKEY